MAAYSQFLGCKVTVQYRVGDILLTASGTLVGDCGRSIFLEQHVEQRGKRNYFRWEIPYPYIHRLEAQAEAEQPAEADLPRAASDAKAAAAAAGESSFGSATIIPFPQRPKTA